MRVFIGVRVKPDEKVKGLLSFLSKQDSVKVVDEGNLHVNLKFLGEVSEKQVEVIEGVLRKIQVPSFKIVFDGVDFFPSEDFVKVVFVKVVSDELIELNKFIEDELFKHGFMKEVKVFVPHLTLARVKKRLPVEVVNKLKSEEVSFSFNVTEIDLIRSVLARDKAFYETIFKINLSEKRI